MPADVKHIKILAWQAGMGYQVLRDADGEWTIKVGPGQGHIGHHVVSYQSWNDRWHSGDGHRLLPQEIAEYLGIAAAYPGEHPMRLLHHLRQRQADRRAKSGEAA